MSNSPTDITKKIISPEKKKQYAEARKVKRELERTIKKAEEAEKRKAYGEYMSLYHDMKKGRDTRLTNNEYKILNYVSN